MWDTVQPNSCIICPHAVQTRCELSKPTAGPRLSSAKHFHVTATGPRHPARQTGQEPDPPGPYREWWPRLSAGPVSGCGGGTCWSSSPQSTEKGPCPLRTELPPSSTEATPGPNFSQELSSRLRTPDDQGENAPEEPPWTQAWGCIRPPEHSNGCVGSKAQLPTPRCTDSAAPGT